MNPRWIKTSKEAPTVHDADKDGKCWYIGGDGMPLRDRRANWRFYTLFYRGELIGIPYRRALVSHYHQNALVAAVRYLKSAIWSVLVDLRYWEHTELEHDFEYVEEARPE